MIWLTTVMKLSTKTLRNWLFSGKVPDFGFETIPFECNSRIWHIRKAQYDSDSMSMFQNGIWIWILIAINNNFRDKVQKFRKPFLADVFLKCVSVENLKRWCFITNKTCASIICNFRKITKCLFNIWPFEFS